MMKRMAMRVSLLAPQNTSITYSFLLESSSMASFLQAAQASLLAGLLSFLYSGVVHHTVSLEVSSITMNLSLGERAGVDAGHHVDGAQFADLALLVAFQAGLGLLGEQLFIRRVVHDLGGAGDTVFGKVNVFHWGNTSLYPSISFTMVSIP